MLVLKRKVGEAIVIGDAIEIVVLGVEGGGVRLGIRAPREVGVFRKELYAEIAWANRAAAAPRDDLRRLLGALGADRPAGDAARSVHPAAERGGPEEGR
ncbi:MAG: carbon storage regulator CsrA [Hydrogenibacillus schlegelii]|uniref:Translational regulator CsrA n=1 Tax=Hydrogenibacillus schlegelii TaxID=1484 RepID=A0A947D452_HYDSH|nr:carbon storage regulator CsrA [Hydrogenibacillus schlegelii]